MLHFYLVNRLYLMLHLPTYLNLDSHFYLIKRLYLMLHVPTYLNPDSTINTKRGNQFLILLLYQTWESIVPTTTTTTDDGRHFNLSYYLTSR